VLNARQDKEEAETIQQAGQPSSITVATNMAGRGTDIRVHPHVVVRGGLHVIASELHDSCRIDRQLFGRCGRQGEPGSYEVMLSFEDELVSTYATRLVEIVKTAFSTNHQRIAAYLGGWVFRCAQRAAERRHRR